MARGNESSGISEKQAHARIRARWHGSSGKSAAGIAGGNREMSS
jgi:hypothetical protein